MNFSECKTTATTAAVAADVAAVVVAAVVAAVAGGDGGDGLGRVRSDTAPVPPAAAFLAATTVAGGCATVPCLHCLLG